VRTLPTLLTIAFLTCCNSPSPAPTDHQAITKEQAQTLSLRGDVRADGLLETYYFQCVSCSAAEKIKWFEIIAKHGNGSAMVNLADVLTRQGGEANCAAAERWLTAAVNQGTEGTTPIAIDWLGKLRTGHMGSCNPRS
jgi:hypothetical protein